MRYASPARLLLVLLVVGGTVVSGCRPGSALHGRYNNFRAYYNTYYNAERSLETGEEALVQSAVTVDRSHLVSIFPATSGTNQGGAFQEAIDKSAELLRNRPDSKWADDALLIIGKAYFYQRNLAGADQKFRETMAAADLTGDQRLADEARFWLGRTYAASNRFDEGVAVLEEGLASQDVDRRWARRMQLALGELYARAGRWDEAAEAIRVGAPEEGDADVAARAYVLLGQVEEHAGRYDAATEAYAQALRQRPAYELAYAAEVGRALTLGIDAGDPAAALDIIRGMRRDDKHYQRRGELALVEARLRAANDEPAVALSLFREVLYEPELNGVSVRGEAHYRLGAFYRDVLGDYIRASAHLDTAATALRGGIDDRPPARGAVLDVADEAQAYSGLAAAARRIVEVDSLLALGALTEDEFRARIDEIEAERRRVYLDEQRRLEAARRAEEFATGSSGLDRSGRSERNTATDAASGADTGDAGFLSFRNPASVQAGLISFQQRWGDRPLVPDWRRRAAIQAGDVIADRGVVGGNVRGGFGLDQGPPLLDLSPVPRTPAKRDEMVVELAGLRYELANAFFLTLGQADTAAALYRTILDETPEAPVAIRARYALAEIERAAGRDDVARPLYQAVAEADTASLRQASLARLGLGANEPEVVASIDETPAAYDAARAQWQGGDPLGGAAALIRVGDASPSSPFAPRAYLAAAAAYVEWADADSLTLRQPLPDSLISAILTAPPVPTEGPGADPDSTVSVAEDTPRERRTDVLNRDRLGGEERAEASDVPVQQVPVQRVDGAEGIESDVEDDESDGLIRQPAEMLPVSQDDMPLAPVDAARPVQVGAVVPDSARAEAALDSLQATTLLVSSPDTTASASADSTAFTLFDHLSAIAVRYPETPYADRASALAAGLAPPALSADSTTSPPGTDSPAATPPARGPGAQPADSTALAVPVDSPPGLRGDEPVDPSLGGVTWAVQRVSIPTEAESTVSILADAGFRVAVLQNREDGSYTIAIGQFDDQVTALTAFDLLPSWARLSGELQSLSEFDAVSGGEGP